MTCKVLQVWQQPSIQTMLVLSKPVSDYMSTVHINNIKQKLYIV